ncbi:DUF2600 family protein [Conexibacter sp. JD483]|uniref:DUF2600 family protein n=1 Tax=unclassified Conexibacter TaxID=2627773 RepID=UPI002724C6F2|nr:MULTISPECIES: DUF2600 family protein [unclassified Conexibacter]MDO8185794.1 DUF2600 family protein [Conexibacter sp. CPCC 205706]MDO8198538.1 DUF2600 family protein [Conexibacter sp. CPCC 205762]MDR9367624.1 DUF2600 family protein [Conexibacter sp. JD483]
MTQHHRRAITATAAMLTALARYQLAIVPVADAEIARWRNRARAIPDPHLRRLTLATLTEEDSNASAAAVFALLAPRSARREAVELLTAWQLMYDLLDTLTEQPSPDPLAAGLRAHRALVASIDPAMPLDEIPAEDGGYLRELAATCRRRLWRLPAAPAIASAAAAEADRCAHAQSHTHAAVLHGDQTALRAWAERDTRWHSSAWWETAAAGISSLAVLALLALAASPRTTPTEAATVANVYGAVCALSTLLDSLVDVTEDETSGNTSYFAHYPTASDAAAGMGQMARASMAAADLLPAAAVHRTIVSGLVAFYLAKLPRSPRADQAQAADSVRAQLGPSVDPALVLLSLRRHGPRPLSQRRARLL